jgi:hypothetical protein
MDVTRKEFLALIVGGVAAAACGGSSSSAPANCLQNGTDDVIAANHGHSLDVTKADIAAGVSKTYDIRGTADHSHLVTIAGSDMATLAGNHSVNTSSTIDGTPAHNHAITVNCV